MESEHELSSDVDHESGEVARLLLELEWLEHQRDYVNDFSRSQGSPVAGVSVPLAAGPVGLDDGSEARHPQPQGWNFSQSSSGAFEASPPPPPLLIAPPVTARAAAVANPALSLEVFPTMPLRPGTSVPRLQQQRSAGLDELGGSNRTSPRNSDAPQQTSSFVGLTETVLLQHRMIGQRQQQLAAISIVDHPAGPLVGVRSGTKDSGGAVWGWLTQTLSAATQNSVGAGRSPFTTAFTTTGGARGATPSRQPKGVGVAAGLSRSTVLTFSGEPDAPASGDPAQITTTVEVFVTAVSVSADCMASVVIPFDLPVPPRGAPANGGYSVSFVDSPEPLSFSPMVGGRTSFTSVVDGATKKSSFNDAESSNIVFNNSSANFSLSRMGTIGGGGGGVVVDQISATGGAHSSKGSPSSSAANSKRRFKAALATFLRVFPMISRIVALDDETVSTDADVRQVISKRRAVDSTLVIRYIPLTPITHAAQQTRLEQQHLHQTSASPFDSFTAPPPMMSRAIANNNQSPWRIDPAATAHPPDDFPSPQFLTPVLAPANTKGAHGGESEMFAALPRRRSSGENVVTSLDSTGNHATFVESPPFNIKRKGSGAAKRVHSTSSASLILGTTTGGISQGSNKEGEEEGGGAVGALRDAIHTAPPGRAVVVFHHSQNSPLPLVESIAGDLGARVLTVDLGQSIQKRPRVRQLKAMFKLALLERKWIVVSNASKSITALTVLSRLLYKHYSLTPQGDIPAEPPTAANSEPEAISPSKRLPFDSLLPSRGASSQRSAPTTMNKNPRTLVNSVKQRSHDDTVPGSSAVASSVVEAPSKDSQTAPPSLVEELEGGGGGGGNYRETMAGDGEEAEDVVDAYSRIVILAEPHPHFPEALTEVGNVVFRLYHTLQPRQGPGGSSSLYGLGYGQMSQMSGSQASSLGGGRVAGWGNPTPEAASLSLTFQPGTSAVARDAGGPQSLKLTMAKLRRVKPSSVTLMSSKPFGSVSGVLGDSSPRKRQSAMGASIRGGLSSPNGPALSGSTNLGRFQLTEAVTTPPQREQVLVGGRTKRRVHICTHVDVVPSGALDPSGHALTSSSVASFGSSFAASTPDFGNDTAARRSESSPSRRPTGREGQQAEATILLQRQEYGSTKPSPESDIDSAWMAATPTTPGVNPYPNQPRVPHEVRKDVICASELLTCLVQAGDGRIATGSSVGNISLFSTKGLRLCSFRAHECSIWAMDFRGHHQLITGSEDALLSMWSHDEHYKRVGYSGRILTRFTNDVMAARYVDPLGSDVVFAGGLNGSLCILNVSTNQRNVIPTPSIVVSLGRVHVRPGRMLLGGGTGLVSVWDAELGRAVESHQRHSQKVSEVLNHNGSLLLSAGFDGAVAVSDMRMRSVGCKVFPLRNGRTGALTALCAMGHLMAVAAEDSLCVYDLRKPVWEVYRKDAAWSGICRGLVADGAEGYPIITGASSDGVIRFFGCR